MASLLGVIVNDALIQKMVEDARTQLWLEQGRSVADQPRSNQFDFQLFGIYFHGNVY